MTERYGFAVSSTCLDSLPGSACCFLLGTIDGLDDTYVNGVKIGSTSLNFKAKTNIYNWNPPNSESENSIAVRIEMIRGRNGFTGAGYTQNGAGICMSNRLPGPGSIADRIFG